MADFDTEQKAKAAAIKDLWQGARATSLTILFVPGQAFTDHWLTHHREMGSVLGREHHHKDADGNTVRAFQAFTLGVYAWTPNVGVSEVGVL